MAAGGAERWSLAPSLLITPGGLLEVEGGYRLGTLRDADFAAHGGSGVFATVGVRFSEGVIQQAAGFWRERLARAQ